MRFKCQGHHQGQSHHSHLPHLVDRTPSPSLPAVTRGERGRISELVILVRSPYLGATQHDVSINEVSGKGISNNYPGQLPFQRMDLTLHERCRSLLACITEGLSLQLKVFSIKGSHNRGALQCLAPIPDKLDDTIVSMLVLTRQKGCIHLCTCDGQVTCSKAVFFPGEW